MDFPLYCQKVIRPGQGFIFDKKIFCKSQTPQNMPKLGWQHAGSSNQTVPAKVLPYPEGRVGENSSMKIIHEKCQNKCLYEGKEQFLSLALKIFCKTPNVSVIEFIGRVAELHTKPQRNCKFKKFESELMLDSNGPTVP